MRSGALLVSLGLVLAGCPGDGPGPAEPGTGGRGPTDAAAQHPGTGGSGSPVQADAGKPLDGPGLPYGSSGPPAVDILFMIDDSASMEQEQASLRANFPAFINELQNLPGGLPSVHIGIISSNMGSGPSQQSDSCVPLGDRGRLLVKSNCGLDPNVAHYLEVDGRGNKNFTGELPTVFSCLANLGIQGCGYEHQLQSIRAALSDVNSENRGFLRLDAFLAIVLLTDEDDCSGTPDSTIFDQNRPGEAFSLRCGIAGHTCGGSPIPSREFTAPLASCRPYEATPSERRSRLINVSELAEFVKTLKPGRPDHLIVSAIMGWDPDINAQYRLTTFMKNYGGGVVTELDLAPACMSANGQATPAVRVKAFTEAFGDSGSWYSICAADLGPVMTNIGRQVASRMR